MNMFLWYELGFGEELGLIICLSLQIAVHVSYVEASTNAPLGSGIVSVIGGAGDFLYIDEVAGAYLPENLLNKSAADQAAKAPVDKSITVLWLDRRCAVGKDAGERVMQHPGRA